MSLPYFFTAAVGAPGSVQQLEEDSSKHIVQVLRMQDGDRVRLTDGKGQTAEATLTRAHKKQTEVLISAVTHSERSSVRLTIAVSLVKNHSRFEWFLEKATELGIAGIIPLICERTEKHHYRADRFAGICRSAMLQSEQSWLPELHPPRSFSDVMNNETHQQKFIAHCMEGVRQELRDLFDPLATSTLVLIGPEGDFTPGEVNESLARGFTPVSLGHTRLRTETAALYAAAICR